MATRQQRLNFAIKRLKGFWNQFKRSKRGVLGILLILFFGIVAIFAPFIATTKPIDPQIGIGEYPAFGSASGARIAETLCAPSWYVYLPWIHRGQTEATETFYTLIRYFPELGINATFYGHEDVENPSDSSLILTNRVSSIKSVESEEGGVFKELNSTQWYIDPTRLREVNIVGTPNNGTRFRVTYETGVDLAENMMVVKDNTLTSNESIHEWTRQTNYPDLLTTTYNNEKGFVFREEDTKRGCIEISYSPGETPPSNPVEATVSRPFTYSHNQPPVSFFIHTSVWVEGAANVTLNILFFKENENGTQSFLVYSQPKGPTGSWKQSSHSYYLSDDPIVIRNVGSKPPQDRIFASPGNFSFSVQVIIPPDSGKTKVYLDDLQCILYGNIYGLMGTDNGKPYPRDIFSLLVWGSRVSLLVGVLSAVFSTIIGLFLGLISGYVGGFIDEGIMRFADLLLVLPTLPLFIVLIVALQAVGGAVNMWNIIIVLTLFGWMSFARSVRSMVLSIRERAFIEAAKAAGAGRLHIINRHIIPNVFTLVYVTLATAVPGAIITEASLSWLGLGDPLTASWGKILYDFNSSSVALVRGLTDYWFWLFPACIAIAALATAFILLGYALDEILNPRLRERR